MPNARLCKGGCRACKRCCLRPIVRGRRRARRNGAFHWGRTVRCRTCGRRRAPCSAATAAHRATLAGSGISMQGQRPRNKADAQEGGENRCKNAGFHRKNSLRLRGYAPAMLRASVRNVGASVPKRKSRSLANVMDAKISRRLPAKVNSAADSAILPSRIINPEAPRL